MIKRGTLIDLAVGIATVVVLVLLASAAVRVGWATWEQLAVVFIGIYVASNDGRVVNRDV
jgi:hypothetical protein